MADGEESLEFNAVETAVLDWCATHARCPEVRAQLRAARPTARTHTGAGSYTDLSVPPELARIPEGTLPNAGHGPILGPDILAPELEHGACTQVYCEDGVLTFMEIAAYGCEFPESLTNVRLLPVDVTDRADAGGEQS